MFVRLFVSILLSILLLGCSIEPKKESKNFIPKVSKESYFYPSYSKEIKEYDNHHQIYLPVYSHVYTSENRYEPMGITVSIRNTDLNESFIIKDVSYYGTDGVLLQKYVDKPHTLKAMATIDFVIDLRDMRGGSGANFIVEVAYDSHISKPIVQAIMINNSGNRAFSFVTNGEVIK